MGNYEEQMSNLARRVRMNLVLKMNESKPVKVIELSKRSGVSISTISRIKNDWEGKEEVELKTIVKLSTALDIDPIELMKEA